MLRRLKKLVKKKKQKFKTVRTPSPNCLHTTDTLDFVTRTKKTTNFNFYMANAHANKFGQTFYVFLRRQLVIFQRKEVGDFCF